MFDRVSKKRKYFFNIDPGLKSIIKKARKNDMDLENLKLNKNPPKELCFIKNKSLFMTNKYEESKCYNFLE